MSALVPIPCREDLAATAQAHFVSTGRAVEVGVSHGVFAQHNLKHWHGDYTCVDGWAQRRFGRGWTVDNPPDSLQSAHYNATQQRVAFAGGRVRLLKAWSKDAAASFPDNHFDWVYLDALHSDWALADDLSRWWRKLRPGGLMSGDDYGDKTDTEFMPWDRWAESYGVAAKTSHWGTIRAVVRFAREHRADLRTTWMRPGRRPSTPSKPGVGCYAYPAWWMVKPLEKNIRSPKNSSLVPVPCRDDLASAAELHFKHSGRAGGIAATDTVRQGWSGEYHELASVWQAHQPFPEGFFDWLHIDQHPALHEVLQRCWPMLRVGGLLSGTYFLTGGQGSEYMPSERWQDAYGKSVRQAGLAHGSMQAVQDFARTAGVVLHVTWMKPAWDEYANCSWAIPGRTREFDYGRGNGRSMGLRSWGGSCGCTAKLPAWYVVKT